MSASHPDFIYLGNLGRRTISLVKTPVHVEGVQLDTGALVARHPDERRPSFFVHRAGLLANAYALLALDSSDAPSVRPRLADAARLLAIGPEEHFDFSGWRIQDFMRFVSECSGEGFYSPYSEDLHTSIETWLVQSLGEAAFFCLRGFWPDELKDLHETGTLKFMYDNSIPLRTRMGNVTVPVDGIPVNPCPVR